MYLHILSFLYTLALSETIAFTQCSPNANTACFKVNGIYNCSDTTNIVLRRPANNEPYQMVREIADAYQWQNTTSEAVCSIYIMMYKVGDQLARVLIADQTGEIKYCDMEMQTNKGCTPKSLVDQQISSITSDKPSTSTSSTTSSATSTAPSAIPSTTASTQSSSPLSPMSGKHDYLSTVTTTIVTIDNAFLTTETVPSSVVTTTLTLTESTTKDYASTVSLSK